MKSKTATIVFLGLFLSTPVLNAAEIPRLVPAEAAKKVESGEAVLVDVREPGEWEESGTVETAHLLALSDLRGERAHWKAFLKENADRELILYCRSGNRSEQAARLLREEGFKTSNAGGFPEWVEDGQPVRQADEARKEPEPARSE